MRTNEMVHSSVFDGSNIDKPKLNFAFLFLTFQTIVRFINKSSVYIIDSIETFTEIESLLAAGCRLLAVDFV